MTVGIPSAHLGRAVAFSELDGFEEWYSSQKKLMATTGHDKGWLMGAFFGGVNWSRMNESGWVDNYGEYHPATKPDQDVMAWFNGETGTPPEVIKGART